jgi:hypothetical protein
VSYRLPELDPTNQPLSVNATAFALALVLFARPLAAQTGPERAFALSQSQVAGERILAADALAELGDPPAIERLGVLLQLDQEPSVRLAAARAFARIRNPRTSPGCGSRPRWTRTPRCGPPPSAAPASSGAWAAARGRRPACH